MMGLIYLQDITHYKKYNDNLDFGILFLFSVMEFALGKKLDTGVLRICQLSFLLDILDSTSFTCRDCNGKNDTSILISEAFDIRFSGNLHKIQ